jgi:putative transcriptional regulator
MIPWKGKMMTSPLKGKVLIASPHLLDPKFAKTVVLIVQHDENGAMGLIINRALQTTVEEVWKQVSSVPYPNSDPLFQGGPCEGPLIVLHKDAARGQLEVCDGVWLSSDSEAVKVLVDEATEPLKFFVGYAGWSASQLEAELAEGAWQLAQIDAALLLATPQGVWEELQRAARKAMRERLRPAVNPRLIPPDPSVN